MKQWIQMVVSSSTTPHNDDHMAMERTFHRYDSVRSYRFSMWSHILFCFFFFWCTLCGSRIVSTVSIRNRTYQWRQYEWKILSLWMSVVLPPCCQSVFDTVHWIKRTRVKIEIVINWLRQKKIKTMMTVYGNNVCHLSNLMVSNMKSHT